MKNIQKGFTLIELLVVIAVIGVLASVVLIAINPLEQINRGRDASAKSDVGSVGNAATAYYTSKASGGGTPYYSNDTATMVTSGDLKLAPASVTYCGGASGTACPNATACTTACTDAIAYVQANSQQSADLAIAAGASGCTKTNTYITWSTSKNKVGYYCGLASGLTAGATVY